MSNTIPNVGAISSVGADIDRADGADRLSNEAAALDFESRLKESGGQDTLFTNASDIPEAIPLQGFPNAAIIKDAES
ncbi:MAG: hypothetical protein AAGE61_04680 [Pseudomonadota bacterium]